MTMITLALSKGRIFEETLPLLAAAGIEVLEDPEKSRKLILPTNQPDVRVVLVRASDVPTYVEYGGADLGVTGKDTLIEHGGADHQVGLGELERAHPTEVVEDALLRLLAHRAGVEKDDVGVFRRVGLDDVFRRCEYVGDFVRIVLVHLAPESADEQFFCHVFLVSLWGVPQFRLG